MTPRTRANDRRNPSRTMPLRISMVSLRPTVYRSCNDAMFADPNYSAVFLRMRWDERAKAYGRGRGERRLRTGGARARPVRTTCSDVETASRASLWASAEGTRVTNSLLRGAVPAHAINIQRSYDYRTIRSTASGGRRHRPYPLRT